MDNFEAGYLAFVLAIIGGIIYMIAAGGDDIGLLGLVMGLLYAVVAGIMIFGVRE